MITWRLLRKTALSALPAAVLLAGAPAAAQQESVTTRTLVREVRDLGPQFTSNTAQVLGHDCAYSIPLSEADGRSLWVFGDTWTGTRSAEDGTSNITGMRTNTMALVRDQDARNGIRGYTYAVDGFGTATIPLAYLPQEEMEKLEGEDTVATRLWPMHGIALPGPGGTSKVILFYSMEKLIKGPPPPANFYHLGCGVATATIHPRDPAPPRFKRVTRNGNPVLWGPDDPIVGTSVLRSAEGDILVYASGKVNNRPAAYLARVHEKTITDPGSYRWFAGKTASNPPSFLGDIRRAVPLFYDMPTEMSVSYNRHLARYIAVHTMLLGPDIGLRTARDPEGPWSEPEIIARPTARHNPTFFYAAKEHPWLSRDLGRTLYLTYIEFHEYWPHLLEVNLW